MISELEKVTAEIIHRNFDLEEIKPDEKLFEKIRVLLIDKIDFLLDYDFEDLLRILYRIDVDEQKAKEALAEKSDCKPSEVLADLIIERQTEKARTLLKYRDNNRANDRKDI